MGSLQLSWIWSLHKGKTNCECGDREIRNKLIQTLQWNDWKKINFNLNNRYYLNIIKLFKYCEERTRK